ncbi:MAG: methyltransferase domain-containing protein [Anaerolineales bacterium]|jgi:ubiquinone/menaquinone biosynthesis C-methylase UbiE
MEKEQSNQSQSPRWQWTTRLMRVFFQLLYHQFAWLYDWVAFTVSLGQWNDWVSSVLPYLKPSLTLELGPGRGHLQISLSKRSIAVYGLEESSQMARATYNRLNSHGFPASIARGCAQQIPFASGAFPQVVSTFPSEYILERRTIKEVYRILLPGGTFVILPMVWITGKCCLDQIAAWLFRITGQSGDWQDNLLEPFQQVGFLTRIEWVKESRWTLVIILAVKSM